MILLAPFIPVFAIAAVIGILIYLIVKRVHDKDKEDFEKRDN